MKALFYPDTGDIVDHHSLCKQRVFCKHLGLRITNDPYDDFDCAVYLDFDDVNEPDEVMIEIGKRVPVVNLHCNNLDRFHIDKMFTKVFGYSSLAKPGEKCIRKGNYQGGGHHAEHTTCPVESFDGYIYQKFIDARINDNTIRVIRPIIFGKKIKALIVKESDASDPFEQNDKISKEYFYNNNQEWNFYNNIEIKQMEKVAELLNIDYAEYDVVRDKDNRIYIIDINNIPGSQVFGRLPNSDYALETMAYEFSKLLH